MTNKCPNKKDCKCGCGKEFPVMAMEKAQCHNCGKLIMGKEICVYHRKQYCSNCCARVRRRGV